LFYKTIELDETLLINGLFLTKSELIFNVFSSMASSQSMLKSGLDSKNGSPPVVVTTSDGQVVLSTGKALFQSSKIIFTKCFPNIAFVFLSFGQ
jgi:hypothetical protein